MIKTYVVGFMFNPDYSRVALIHKRHGPECVVGRWNGVGGKIEPTESAYHAMVREFQEETGVFHLGWTCFCVLTSGTAVVHFFYASSPCINDLRTMTDEEIKVFGTGCFPRAAVVKNLTWMIPFLCDQTTVHNLGSLRMSTDPVV